MVKHLQLSWDCFSTTPTPPPHSSPLQLLGAQVGEQLAQLWSRFVAWGVQLLALALVVCAVLRFGGRWRRG